MRLQLITVAAAVVVHAGAARAQSDFTAKLQVYADDDHTTVVSPVVHASAEVSDDDTIALGYLADVVTSASIDVVSQASATTIHDVRHQVAASESHTFGSLTADAGYTYATENDYQAHTLSLGASKGLFDKDTTIALGYALELDTVGRSGDHNFSKGLTVHAGTLSLTQILTKRFVVQASYELGYAQGYQASAYRYVPVMDDNDVPMGYVPETDPDTRFRHAGVVGMNWFLPKDSSIQADYRLYHDTWGITSHTIGARYYVNFGDRVELRLRSRFYVQNGASFYQARYDTFMKYMTADRELSPLWSETVGAKLTVGFTDRLEGEAKLDGFYYRYSDFPALASRLGVNVGLGLELHY